MRPSLRFLGVMVPAHADGGYAKATAEALVRSAEGSDVAVAIVVVDDGDNGDLQSTLPADERVVLVKTEERGPGTARTKGAISVAELASARGVGEEQAWLVSLDADVSLDEGFVASWVEAIRSSEGDILSGPSHFVALGDEPSLSEDAEAASSWMWSDTSLYERFVGVVNLGGCNHAVSLRDCIDNSFYLQPTTELSGRKVLVAGDDWDFGLRARMRGRTIRRVGSPLVKTSSRRIASDPVGFLAGRIYEGPFGPVRTVTPDASWPPAETWSSIALRGRARLVAHFLLKPILAGLRPQGSLAWFIGDELASELEKLRAVAPKWEPTSDWNAFRSALIELIFEEEPFDWCSRVAQKLAGGS